MTDAFANVRAAYGLLHSYHARAQETMRLLAVELGSWKEFRHEKAVRGFTASTRDAFTRDERNGAWNFLPFHTVWAYYSPEGQDDLNAGIGQSQLCIALCTDTAAFSPFGKSQDDPTPSLDGEGRSGLCLNYFQLLSAEDTNEWNNQRWFNHLDWWPEKRSADIERAYASDFFRVQKFFDFRELVSRQDIEAAAQDFAKQCHTAWVKLVELGEFAGQELNSAIAH